MYADVSTDERGIDRRRWTEAIVYRLRWPKRQPTGGVATLFALVGRERV